MKEYSRAVGFEAEYDKESRILILGSFPSVKSRRVEFYYGNGQNRFWRTVCGFFGEEIPEDTAGKKEFLHRRHIALWDVVMACDIVGSSDASILNEEIADIPALLNQTGIRKVLCNGSKAYELLCLHFPEIGVRAIKLPSTSPANPRFSSAVWAETLAACLNQE